MAQSGVNLAGLIGSRICHDLISPVGAITNGLELLEMTGAVQGPEMDLISDSVNCAEARIKFFRIAYGAAGEQQIGRAEVASIFDDLNRGNRVRAEWCPVEPVLRSETRLAFLALQCCETAMPVGGEVKIEETSGNWRVTGTASRLAVDPSLWEGLSNPAALVQITPAQVQFALLPAVAADTGRRITVETTESQVIISF